MTRRAVIGAALGGATALGIASCSRAAAPTAPAWPTPPTRPSLEVVSRRRSGQVEDWVLRTDAVDRPVGVRVLLPASYDAHPARRYPVVHLLHGSGGDSRWWFADPRPQQLLSRYEVIAVMPDAGHFGWYLDWAREDLHGRWESLHVLGILPAVDETYRTLATRAGRAVAGISMGGFGAIHYAQFHPELFAAATSFSGALSLRSPIDFVALDAQSRDDKPVGAIFGSDDVDAKARRVDPVLHTDRLRDVRVRLYAGTGAISRGAATGRPGEDMEPALLDGARAFAKAAHDAGVDAPLTTLPGGHDWDTWVPALARELPGLVGALAPATG